MTNEIKSRRVHIRTSSNFNLESPYDFEHNEGVSQTVPDQALSVRELLDRQRRGISIPQFNPVYDGDIDLPDFKKMDLTERQDYLEHTSDRILRLRSELSAAQQSAKREQEQKREEKLKGQDSAANPDPKNKEKS